MGYAPEGCNDQTQLKQLSTRTHNICCAVSIARQCLTLCNPTGCSPPGCMGFSKQEYWSGEPCPPPGIFLTQGSNLPLLCPLHWQVDSLPLCPLGSPHIICETHSVVSNSVTLWTTQSMEFSRPIYWSGYPFPAPGNHPNPGIDPSSPPLQAYSLPTESPGKPRNTGVGSLSCLQQIFLTQESHQGPLHCRQILYQLSYQGSPPLGMP